MEFDDMKKIWDTQNNGALFVINEKALHNRILSKKSGAGHLANISELLLILVNAGAAITVFSLSLPNPGGNVALYLLALWMLLTMTYILVSRARRRREENRFDRTMLGDLDHAISTATYQERLSLLMRWNNLPIGLFILLSAWENGKALWVVGLVLILFSLAHLFGGWEHGVYRSRKKELETLREKLVVDR